MILLVQCTPSMRMKILASDTRNTIFDKQLKSHKNIEKITHIIDKIVFTLGIQINIEGHRY